MRRKYFKVYGLGTDTLFLLSYLGHSIIGVTGVLGIRFGARLNVQCVGDSGTSRFRLEL
jgi:hypothetical protein